MISYFVNQFEYEYDEKGDKSLLGRGTYGCVYAVRDTRTQVRMAVKEIPIKDMRLVIHVHGCSSLKVDS